VLERSLAEIQLCFRRKPFRRLARAQEAGNLTLAGKEGGF
jgi:hypothetical protein